MVTQAPVGPPKSDHRLGISPCRSGKVRDVYELPPTSDDADGRIVMVATDRVSAFDVIMPTPIPGKGRLLTEISTWWLRFIQSRGLAETHLISTNLNDVPASAFTGSDRSWFEGRVTIGRRCNVIPVECVVRGYLEGSGWKEYQETGAISGVSLPKGLQRCQRLDEPIFTPATKAAVGHDENISFETAAEHVGLETMGALRDMSLAIYRAAAAHALSRGIIIADTKFEFGIPCGTVVRSGRVWTQPILIDEALTPDSSRFWPVDGYAPARTQPSFDKQFLREYLESLVQDGAWNKTPPGPELPDRVVKGTLDRYREARDRLCT